MNEPDPQSDRTLEMAARVALILEGLGVPCALIGAAGLAVHGYPRATSDIDLAVATDPFSVLREAQRLKLYAGGYTSRLDVLALLERNPDFDVGETQRVCSRFGLDEDLRAVLADFGA